MSSLRKQSTFRDVTTAFPAKRLLRNDCGNSILMTCHYPDLSTCTDTSSVWNFCARSLTVISPGNQCWLRKMSAVFSGYKCPVYTINPFITKFGKKQISTKFPDFILWNFEKLIAPCVSSGRELSFEWSHHRISSSDSKVRVTLQTSIKHSGTERVNLE